MDASTTAGKQSFNTISETLVIVKDKEMELRKTFLITRLYLSLSNTALRNFL